MRVKKLNWITDLNDFTIQSDDPRADWLLKAKQISPHLKQCYQQVTLKVLSEGWDTPFEDEREGPGLACEEGRFWIRRIVLLGDNQPCTYGRTVIPEATFQHYATVFESLGSTFIGEGFLYQQAKATRSAFEYTACEPDHPRYRVIANDMPGIVLGEPLWLRRSQFHVDGFPLLLTEAVLPNIASFPER